MQLSNSVVTAAESGSRRDVLVAIRTRVAAAVDDPKTSSRDLAALTRRLVDVVRDIEAIDVMGPEGQWRIPDAPFTAADI